MYVDNSSRSEENSWLGWTFSVPSIGVRRRKCLWRREKREREGEIALHGVGDDASG